MSLFKQRVVVLPCFLDFDYTVYMYNCIIMYMRIYWLYYVYLVAYTALEQKHLEFKQLQLLTMAPPTHKFYDLYISAHNKKRELHVLKVLCGITQEQ